MVNTAIYPVGSAKKVVTSIVTVMMMRFVMSLNINVKKFVMKILVDQMESACPKIVQNIVHALTDTFQLVEKDVKR